MKRKFLEKRLKELENIVKRKPTPNAPSPPTKNTQPPSPTSPKTPEQKRQIEIEKRIAKAEADAKKQGKTLSSRDKATIRSNYRKERQGENSKNFKPGTNKYHTIYSELDTIDEILTKASSY